MGKWLQDAWKWIVENKDWLFGSGIFLVVVGGIYRFFVWLAKARRARKTRTDTSPFKIIPPNSNVAKEVLGGADDDPLADRNIPYQQRVQERNIRREIEDLLEGEHRWVLITGRTGLGKTREAVHVAESLNGEGWTVLYLTREQWLDAPARLPTGIPERKLLFLLDDLNRKCYAGRVEQSPKAGELLQPLTEPLQKRIQRTLEAYETLCGKGEIRVIATARDEQASEYRDEPSEWDKLEFGRYPGLWQWFTRYELSQPQDAAAKNLLVQTVPQTNIRAKTEDFAAMAQRNDGTFANLIENLRTARNTGQPFSQENFRETLKGTWEHRFQLAEKKYPESKYIYMAIALLRYYRIPLYPYTVKPLARTVVENKSLLLRWKVDRAFDYIHHRENILEPKDGQVESCPEVHNLDTEKYLKEILTVLLFAGLLRQNQLQDSVFLLLMYLFQNEKKSLELRNFIAVIMASYFPFETMALLFYGKGNQNIALKILTRSHSNNIFTIIFMSMIYKHMGQPEKAIKVLRSAITSGYQCKSLLHNELGSVYRELKQYDDAIAAYRKAIELDPKYAHPWHNLGNIYYDQGCSDKAISAYNQAIGIDIRRAAPWCGLGNIYHGQGKTDEAIAAFQKSIELERLWCMNR
jgi:tetratricopeptide (TPR) repeat protein